MPKKGNDLIPKKLKCTKDKCPVATISRQSNITIIIITTNIGTLFIRPARPTTTDYIFGGDKAGKGS